MLWSICYVLILWNVGQVQILRMQDISLSFPVPKGFAYCKAEGRREFSCQSLNNGSILLASFYLCFSGSIGLRHRCSRTVQILILHAVTGLGWARSYDCHPWVFEVYVDCRMPVAFRNSASFSGHFHFAFIAIENYTGCIKCYWLTCILMHLY